MSDQISPWRKSRHSDSSGACVEVATFMRAPTDNGRKASIHIRDSKCTERTILRFTPEAWVTFAARIAIDNFPLFDSGNPGYPID